MKYAKLLAMGCAVALATVGMTGCTKTTADSTQTSEAEESESVTAQVTAVDGNTVTADDIKEGGDASNGTAGHDDRFGYYRRWRDLQLHRQYG